MAGYTVDQLYAKLEKADAAGDTEAAKVIADEIRRSQQPVAPSSASAAAVPEPQGETAIHALGRGARDVLVGVAGIPDIVTKPLAAGANALHIPGLPQQGGFVDLANYAADAMHLPKPENATQRVQSDVGRALSGTAVTMGAGAALGPGSRLGQFLSANPVQQTVASATGATAGGVARENGASPGVQMLATLAGGIGPSLVSTLPKMALRLIVRGGEEGRQMMQAVINDFKAAGTSPTVGQATQSPVWRGVESLLAKFPGSSGVMERKAAQQGQQIGAGVASLADTLAPGADATSAGQAIRQGVLGPDGFQRQQAATSSRLYGNLDSAIPANSRVPVPNTAQVLGSVNPEIPGAPNLTPLFQNGRIASIADMFAKDAAPAPGGLPGVAGPRLPYQAVQKLRTAVGKEVANANFASDVPTGDWRAIYGGLSRDMEGAANDAGPQAQQAFSRANSHYRAVQNRSDAIAHVVNKEVPEDVFNAAMRGTRDGATTLRKVMQSIPEGSQKEVASAVLRRMGRAINSQQDATGEAFSTQTFLTNWNKLGDPARKALFDRFGPEFRAKVDAITRVASNLRDGSKVFANPSGTATTAAHIGGYTALGSSGVGALLGHPGPFAATAGTMGSANVLARLMAHPGVVESFARKTRIPYGVLSPLAIQQLEGQ